MTAACPIPRCEAMVMNTTLGIFCGLHGKVTLGVRDLCPSCGSDDPRQEYATDRNADGCEDVYHRPAEKRP